MRLNEPKRDGIPFANRYNDDITFWCGLSVVATL
jgi:hypothetical protein